MIDLVNTLPGLLENLASGDEARKAVVFAIWKNIAGEALAERAVPVDFSGGRLFLAVENETWRKNLESLGGQLVYKLNAAFGQPTVNYIEFLVDESAVRRVGKREKESEEARLEFERVALKNVPRDVKRAAAAIENEELRRSFLLAAGGCIVRKNKGVRS